MRQELSLFFHRPVIVGPPACRPISTNGLPKERVMTERMRQLGLRAGATLMALGLAAAVMAASQNQNTNEPQRPFSGPRGRGLAMMGGGPMGPLGFLGPVVERLGLTDAQKDQVKAILAAHQTDLKTLVGEAATAHKALDQAILLDPVSDAAVQSASAGVAAVEAQMAVVAAHVRAEVFQVLTDDQKAQIKTMVAKRDAAQGQRGRGRGPGI
jgi:Spy/CpxP family protein refolding chaperone